jgi:hypothetical protein
MPVRTEKCCALKPVEQHNLDVLFVKGNRVAVREAVENA